MKVGRGGELYSLQLRESHFKLNSRSSANVYDNMFKACRCCPAISEKILPDGGGNLSGLRFKNVRGDVLP
jgi:hypothetical protein